MIDKDILEGLSELDEADLKRIKLLVDNKLNIQFFSFLRTLKLLPFN